MDASHYFVPAVRVPDDVHRYPLDDIVGRIEDEPRALRRLRAFGPEDERAHRNASAWGKESAIQVFF